MPARQHPVRNGFTLIEMLVALAVFALAALTLMRLEGASLSATADLDRRLLREIVAQNLAAEWLTDPRPPALGKANGDIENMGRTFRWTRQASADAEFGALRITLSVAEITPGAPSQAITLTFLREAAQ